VSSIFEVGGHYRTRREEYEVLSIKGDSMRVRYLSGIEATLSVHQQEIIWRNIQQEKRLPLPPPPPPPPPSRDTRIIRPPTITFEGLSANDFQKGITGTHWRARDSLGGAVAQRLSALAKRRFQSYAIYPRAEVHIADPNRYDDTNKFPEAKFVIYLDHECARYGFYVEKRDKPMDEKWDWRRFLVALKRQELQHKIWLAARERNLRWEIDTHDQLVGWICVRPKESELWIWQEDGQEQVIAWSDLLAKLDAINDQAERWCDVLIVANLPKEDALKEGAEIIERIARVYEALLPIYDACSK